MHWLGELFSLEYEDQSDSTWHLTKWAYRYDNGRKYPLWCKAYGSYEDAIEAWQDATKKEAQ